MADFLFHYSFQLDDGSLIVGSIDVTNAVSKGQAFASALLTLSDSRMLVKLNNSGKAIITTNLVDQLRPTDAVVGP